ncbi:MAG: hypothetical protein IJV48_05530 [Ruminococcus sp.]|nr:hypothetical protein [Ruminococcus sp.]
MKRIICALTALTLTVTCVIFTACKKQTDAPTIGATETTEATIAQSTVSPIGAEKTPQEEETVQGETAGQDNEIVSGQAETAAAIEEPESKSDDQYAGMTLQAATQQAFDEGVVSGGYKCVSQEQRFLRNREAWYLGFQTTDGSDETVYYVYVGDGFTVPEQEIPVAE